MCHQHQCYIIHVSQMFSDSDWIVCVAAEEGRDINVITLEVCASTRISLPKGLGLDY